VTAPNEIVVFLGPSLETERARTYLDALYRPPAEQGHIIEIVRRHRPRAIVLIDGAFASVPAVRHKEILWALSRGVEVFGAASLGALRAAELAGFGMQGHGFIYRWFRAHPFAEDDEVAVAMTPPSLGAAPLSDALIDMRLTFRKAERAGIISAELRRLVAQAARAAHFQERSYSGVFEAVRLEGPSWAIASLPELEAWIRRNGVSQKSVDAEGLLRWVVAPTRQRVRTPLARFAVTEAFLRDAEAAGLDVSGLCDDA
jgi:hypothetical protein